MVLAQLAHVGIEIEDDMALILETTIFENIVRCVDNNHNNSCCPHIVVVR